MSRREEPSSKEPKTPLKFGQRVIVRLAPLIIRVLAATWRVRTYNESGWRTLRRDKKPLVFSLWHGHILPLLLWHRKQGIVVLISEHRDGEMIAQVAEHFGFRTVRGSTTRGATRAVLSMSRLLEAGDELAITPDGPRGPVHTFAPGALIVAHRAQVPIVCIGVHASRAWRLKSWDAFMIPKPFATISIVYGDPSFVEGADVREAVQEQQVKRFELAMNDLVAQAETVQIQSVQRDVTDREQTGKVPRL